MSDVPDDLLPEAPPVLDPEDGGGERPREAAHVLVPLPLLLGRESPTVAAEVTWGFSLWPPL